MKCTFVFAIFCLVASLTCAMNEHKEEKERIRAKRVIGALAPLIGGALVAGASLVGTTAGGLKSPTATVSVSGSVENYSKWAMKLKTCQIATGYMNVPMRTVVPGYREGFASHKTSDAAKGTYVRCIFASNGNLIHLMYSAPYSFDFHSNYLGVAICPASNEECKSITADKMYYKKTQFVTVKEYYSSISELVQCHGDFCITGIMGTSHRPEVDFKIYPKDYENLSSAVQKSSAKDRWTKDDYKTFVDNM